MQWVKLLGSITIFPHDDINGHRSFTRSDRDLRAADSLDGSEMPTKYPPNFSRVYRQS